MKPVPVPAWLVLLVVIATAVLMTLLGVAVSERNAALAVTPTAIVRIVTNTPSLPTNTPLPTSTPTQSPTPDFRGGIIQGVTGLADLVTYETQFARANIAISVRYGVGGVCNVGAKHAIQGSIRAAIDLSSITREDVQFDPAKNQLTLTVPGPRLAFCALDTPGIIQYDTFGRVPVTCPQPYAEFIPIAAYVAMTGFRQSAREGNMLERAERQAQVVLEGILKAAIPNGERVRVVVNFDKARTPPDDPSCVPSPPQGWRYDPVRNRWDKQ